MSQLFMAVNNFGHKIFGIRPWFWVPTKKGIQRIKNTISLPGNPNFFTIFKGPFNTELQVSEFEAEMGNYTPTENCWSETARVNFH